MTPFRTLQPFRWLVAAGGYRSGSTLQYNLAGEYVERTGQGRRVGLVEPDDIVRIGERHREEPGILVAKCHHVVSGFRPFESPEAWATEMDSGRARGMISVRPAEDVRRSMCRKFGLSDEELDSSIYWRENTANVARWRELGAVVQPYSQLVSEPSAALRSLITSLGLAWDDSAAAASADATSREAVLRSMAQIPSGTYDPLTLVHFDHVAEW